jgi:type IV pilus assembly protein PilP
MMKAFPIALLAASLLAGCSSADSDLDDFVTRTKQEQPAGVEPLPEVKPYESFFYTAQSLRSPFLPGGSGESSSPSVRPDSKRNREFLEQFSLDTLKMVGTLTMGGRRFGLVKTSDGIVHRVQPGNHLGQNEGRIAQIEDSKISVTEIVPDGLGGYMERGAQLALNE